MSHACTQSQHNLVTVYVNEVVLSVIALCMGGLKAPHTLCVRAIVHAVRPQRLNIPLMLNTVTSLVCVGTTVMS